MKGNVHEFAVEAALAKSLKDALGDVAVERGSLLRDETPLPLCVVNIVEAVDAVPTTATMDVTLDVAVMTYLDQEMDEHIALCARVFNVIQAEDLLSRINAASGDLVVQMLQTRSRRFDVNRASGFRASTYQIILRVAMLEA